MSKKKVHPREVTETILDCLEQWAGGGEFTNRSFVSHHPPLAKHMGRVRTVLRKLRGVKEVVELRRQAILDRPTLVDECVMQVPEGFTASKAIAHFYSEEPESQVPGTLGWGDVKAKRAAVNLGAGDVSARRVADRDEVNNLVDMAIAAKGSARPFVPVPPALLSDVRKGGLHLRRAVRTEAERRGVNLRTTIATDGSKLTVYVK